MALSHLLLVQDAPVSLKTMSAASHSRRVCCVAQQTCLPCHATDMSAMSRRRSRRRCRLRRAGQGLGGRSQYKHTNTHTYFFDIYYVTGRQVFRLSRNHLTEILVPGCPFLFWQPFYTYNNPGGVLGAMGRNKQVRSQQSRASCAGNLPRCGRYCGTRYIGHNVPAIIYLP